ncbi:MAG: IclR family transcriptional regulator [Firmicutes bacterium]|nr:IclR family transcriptional regulator [Bacillota bacterium]
MTQTKNQPNAIDKTISVIDFISEGDVTFTDIQQALELPKATLHRILQSLELYDYIIRNADTEKYRLGKKFIYYGEVVKSQTSIVTIAEGPIKALAEKIGEHVGLSAYYQNHTMTLFSQAGDSSTLTSTLIPFSPLNCSASGKCYLSYMDDDALQNYFTNGPWVKKTVNSICTFADFKAEQARILERGIAYDDEEYEYGLYCMSVPLFNHQGPIFSNVGISAPKARLFMKGADEIEQALRKCGDEISKILTEIRYQPEYIGE